MLYIILLLQKGGVKRVGVGTETCSSKSWYVVISTALEFELSRLV